MTPFVDIIMPVYKTKKEQLYEAIKSILMQTYQNYKLLILIDENDDFLRNEILTTFDDKRIEVYCNSKNMGLPYTLNRGIDLSSGKYIFRMDSDDLSLATRIQKQVDFMEAHSDVDVLSTYAETFEGDSGIYKSSILNEDLKAELLWKNPIVHPTVVFRAETLKIKKIRYSSGASEDYRMWLAMAYKHWCNFSVLPEVLLKYRIHSDQVTKRGKSEIRDVNVELLNNVYRKFGADFNEKEMLLMDKCRLGYHLSWKETFQCIEKMKKLVKHIPNGVSRRTLVKCMARSLLKSMI